MNVPDTPFWIYSVAVYDRADVASTCLTLQDRFGLDVNLILLCCWLGSRGIILDHAKATRAAAIAEEWASPVIGPIRAVRRHLKKTTADEFILQLRTQISALELEVEKIQQYRLYQSFGALPPTPDPQILPIAAGNLMSYLTAQGRALDPSLRKILIKLLAAVFPDAAEVDIVSSVAIPTTNPKK